MDRLNRIKKALLALALALVLPFTLYPQAGPAAHAAEPQPELLSVMLPSEIPFRMILPRNGGTGFVESDAFKITNHSTGAVEVSLDDAWVHIEDPARFTLMETEQLPESGSSIFLQLSCLQDGTTTDYVLTASPTTTHTFWLESGESASFQIGGLVQEHGDDAWSQTQVTVSLCFGMTTHFAPPDDVTPEQANSETPDDEAAMQPEGLPESTPALPDDTTSDVAPQSEVPETPESGSVSVPEPEPTSDSEPVSEPEPGPESQSDTAVPEDTSGSTPEAPASSSSSSADTATSGSTQPAGLPKAAPDSAAEDATE